MTRDELENIIMSFMGRGGDVPTPEEVREFKEAEEELES